MKIKDWRMNMKRIFLLFCMGIFLLSGISVYAQEKEVDNKVDVGENTEVVVEIESKETGELPEYTGNVGVSSGNTRDENKPVTAYNWDNGVYYIDGYMNGTSYIYTSKYFTDFTNAKLVVSAAREYNGTERHDVQVIIYRMGTLFDTEIDRFTVAAGSSKTYNLSNFQADKKYYIQFNGAPFRVTGSLTKTS